MSTTPPMTWVDPQTGDQVQLEWVKTMIARYEAARSTSQRNSVAQVLWRYAALISRARDRLERDLHAGWDVLDPQEDSPRMEKWRSWLVAYEQACDALSLITNVTVHDERAA